MVEKVWIAIWFPFQKQLTLNLLHGGRNIKKKGSLEWMV